MINQLTSYESNHLVLVKYPFQEQNKMQKFAPKYRRTFKIIYKINDANYLVQSS